MRPVTGERYGNFVVASPLGLHARAAARLVQAASGYSAEITLTYAGATVNGKSILGVLMLAAAQGAEVLVRAVGKDAQQALEAVARVIQDAKPAD